MTTPTATAPDVAAAVRVMHRRHSWSRLAAVSLVTAALAAGGGINAASQGTPPPAWYAYLTGAIAAVAVVGFVGMGRDSASLRRQPAAVRDQAAPLVAHQRRTRQIHHYPVEHRLLWSLAWVGMVLILGVGVLSVSAVVDGVAYLAGAEHTVTFDPTSYQTTCTRYDICQTRTDGILETGGAGVQTAWPDQVPLGQPFQVREPVWKWGLGGALINNDRIAVVAVLVSLLIEGASVLVIISAVKLLAGRRHRQPGATR